MGRRQLGPVLHALEVAEQGRRQDLLRLVPRQMLVIPLRLVHLGLRARRERHQLRAELVRDREQQALVRQGGAF
jgi:hypothetical protein|eukprot:COSAG06_NODE_3313_length_5520_cov_2.512910_3_plen_74_part_00